MISMCRVVRSSLPMSQGGLVGPRRIATMWACARGQSRLDLVVKLLSDEGCSRRLVVQRKSEGLAMYVSPHHSHLLVSSRWLSAPYAAGAVNPLPSQQCFLEPNSPRMLAMSKDLPLWGWTRPRLVTPCARCDALNERAGAHVRIGVGEGGSVYVSFRFLSSGFSPRAPR